MIGPLRPGAPQAARTPSRTDAKTNARAAQPPDDGANGDVLHGVSSANGDVVRYGSLDVPTKHAHEFEAAAKYLSRDPKMRAILDKAQHLGHALHIRINAHDDDSYDPSTQTVHWDPHSALQTTDGGRQSPALGLGHELDHATVDPAVRVAGSWSFDAQYDNAEERRVVNGSEAHAARTLGEDIRHDHAGSAYTVSSPIVRRTIA